MKNLFFVSLFSMAMMGCASFDVNDSPISGLFEGPQVVSEIPDLEVFTNDINPVTYKISSVAGVESVYVSVDNAPETEYFPGGSQEYIASSSVNSVTTKTIPVQVRAISKKKSETISNFSYYVDATPINSAPTIKLISPSPGVTDIFEDTLSLTGTIFHYRALIRRVTLEITDFRSDGSFVYNTNIIMNFPNAQPRVDFDETLPLANGSVVVVVIAESGRGNVKAITNTYKVNAPGPIIRLINKANNATLYDNKENFQFEITHTRELYSVRISTNGTDMPEYPITPNVRSTNFSFNFDIPSNPTFMLGVVVFPISPPLLGGVQQGTVSTSNYTFPVDHKELQDPPIVAITSPVHNGITRSPVTIAASLSHRFGVAGVSFSLEHSIHGNKIDVSSNFSSLPGSVNYSTNIQIFQPGYYKMKLMAISGKGVTNTAPIERQFTVVAGGRSDFTIKNSNETIKVPQQHFPAYTLLSNSPAVTNSKYYRNKQILHAQELPTPVSPGETLFFRVGTPLDLGDNVFDIEVVSEFGETTRYSYKIKGI